MGIMDVLNPISVGADILGGLFNMGADVWKAGYQMDMQKKAWSREDSAIQRRVADLKAAGLSPVLAAGQGATSMAPIDITRPTAPTDSSAKMALLMDMMRQKQEISKSAAETALTEKMQRNADLDALNKQQEYEGRKIDVMEKAVKLQSDRRDLELNIKDGLRSNDTGIARDLSSIARAITNSFGSGSTAGSFLDAIFGKKPGDKAKAPNVGKNVEVPGYHSVSPGVFVKDPPPPRIGRDSRNR